MAQGLSPSVPQFSPPAAEQGTRTMTPQESRQELWQAIRGSNQVLARAQTVLALFPDTMIIDRAKVTVTKRQFFRTADVMSVRIEDILNATCTVGPFFGTVTLVSRVMNDDQITTIGRFWRADAKRLKRVLQGYIIALQRGIDCSSLETRELAGMLEKLGADNHPHYVD
jgi:nucleotidyltransferase/DNA polymerase involved in DNA repair